MEPQAVHKSICFKREVEGALQGQISDRKIVWRAESLLVSELKLLGLTTSYLTTNLRNYITILTGFFASYCYSIP